MSRVRKTVPHTILYHREHRSKKGRTNHNRTKTARMISMLKKNKVEKLREFEDEEDT